MDLLAALPDFLLAGSALLTWYDPSILGAGKVEYFPLLMALEFVVVHSAAFMGWIAYRETPKFGRAAEIVAVGLFYTIFVAAFAIVFHQTWPLWAFWILVVNRLAGVLLGQGGRGGAAAVVRAGWTAGITFYLVTLYVAILLPLPRLGITPAVVAAHPAAATGLWVDEPWRVLAMATLYFTLQGVSTLKAHSWVPGRAGLT